MDISLNNGGGDDVYQSGSSFLESNPAQSRAGNNGRFSGVALCVIQQGSYTELEVDAGVR